MNIKKLLFLSLLFAAPCFPQGMRFDNFVLKPTQSGGVTPVSGALITVCTSAGTDTPCTPKVANIYSDEAMTQAITGTGGSGTTNSDANGNFGFYLTPGSYIVTVTGTGITSYTIKVMLPLGTAATNTLTNQNAVYWAGPGATPTIDQAVTACGSNPCIVEISPTYTGPDSVNLFTTSLGYKVYNGANNVTIIDHRQVDSGAGNPTGTNLYGMMFGGRNAGALNRIATNYYAHNPNDSSTGTNGFNWIDGTLPSNNGAQYGSISFATTHDTLTIGSSTSQIAGADAEAYHNATTVDKDLPYISGETSQAGISRANATGNILTVAAHSANACANVSATAKIENCYNYDAFRNTNGVAANYSFHGYSTLWEASHTYDYVDAGFSITAASEASTTVTITTSGVCNFLTGQRVRITGVGTTSFGYNGIWTVLTPGCNGGSTFTYTNTASGLATLGAGGIAAGLYTFIGPNATGDMTQVARSYTFKTPQLSTRATIDSTGIKGSGTVGAIGVGGAFLGGVGSEFAGAYFQETAAPSGSAGDTVFGSTSADHMASFIQNNAGGIQHWPSTVVLHSAYTNATTTFSTLSDGTRTATFAAAANVDYLLTCDIVYQASATTAGPKIQVTGPASPTAVSLSASGGTNATVFGDAAVTAFSTPLTAFGTAGATATNFTLRIVAGIANGANAGTVALQLAANGAGTLTVNAGSACRIQ